MKYPALLETNPYTYTVVRLEEEEEATVAAAFLRWRRTWSHNGFGWNIDYQAAKDAIKRSSLQVDEYIDLLYEIKDAWLGAEMEKKK